MPTPQEAAASLMGLNPVQTAVPLASEQYPGAVQSMSAALQSPNNLAQQAFEASEQLRNTGQYNPAPVVQAASMLMGGGMPAAEAGAAGIFGGMLAKGADSGKLGLANMLELRGVHPTEIWQSTGWARGPDRQWRFEIPDRMAAFNSGSYERGLPTTVGQALHHPPLYKAYPDLQQLPLDWVRDDYYQGMHTPADIGAGPEKITLSQGATDRRSTLLHELQHAVQVREGFSRGTNDDIYKNRVQIMLGKYGAPKDLQGKKLSDWIDDLAFKGYQTHPGEIEARNVQRRLPFTYIERSAIPPSGSSEKLNIADEYLKYLGR